MTDIYVRSTGSNSNPGTDARPKQTLTGSGGALSSCTDAGGTYRIICDGETFTEAAHLEISSSVKGDITLYARTTLATITTSEGSMNALVNLPSTSGATAMRFRGIKLLQTVAPTQGVVQSSSSAADIDFGLNADGVRCIVDNNSTAKDAIYMNSKVGATRKLIVDSTDFLRRGARVALYAQDCTEVEWTNCTDLSGGLSTYGLFLLANLPLVTVDNVVGTTAASGRLIATFVSSPANSIGDVTVNNCKGVGGSLVSLYRPTSAGTLANLTVTNCQWVGQSTTLSPIQFGTDQAGGAIPSTSLGTLTATGNDLVTASGATAHVVGIYPGITSAYLAENMIDAGQSGSTGYTLVVKGNNVEVDRCFVNGPRGLGAYGCQNLSAHNCVLISFVADKAGLHINTNAGMATPQGRVWNCAIGSIAPSGSGRSPLVHLADVGASYQVEIGPNLYYRYSADEECVLMIGAVAYNAMADARAAWAAGTDGSYTTGNDARSREITDISWIGIPSPAVYWQCTDLTNPNTYSRLYTPVYPGAISTPVRKLVALGGI